MKLRTRNNKQIISILFHFVDADTPPRREAIGVIALQIILQYAECREISRHFIFKPIFFEEVTAIVAMAVAVAVDAETEAEEATDTRRELIFRCETIRYDKHK